MGLGHLPDQPQAKNAVARYIDGCYSPIERHSSRDFQSHITFEHLARDVR